MVPFSGQESEIEAKTFAYHACERSVKIPSSFKLSAPLRGINANFELLLIVTPGALTVGPRIRRMSPFLGFPSSLSCWYAVAISAARPDGSDNIARDLKLPSAPKHLGILRHAAGRQRPLDLSRRHLRANTLFDARSNFSTGFHPARAEWRGRTTRKVYRERYGRWRLRRGRRRGRNGSARRQIKGCTRVEARGRGGFDGITAVWL